MLILLPASEAKNAVDRGKRLDLATLSFPSLGPTRSAVLDALIDVSAGPDALRRLGVRETLRDAVLGNTTLRESPTALVEDVYAGVLYDAISLHDLDAAARRRARGWIIIISALWGAVRPGDRVPPYRLNMCGRLPGVAHLPQAWQGALSEVLPGAAGRGVVVDLRTSGYATSWRPTPELAERTVVVKVVRDLVGSRGAGAHNAKRTGGLLVRRIITEAIDPRRPQDLADALSDHFDVELRRPDRPGRTCTLHVVESAG